MAERKVLGRGLRALLAEPEAAGIQEIPVDAIASSLVQPRQRFDAQEMEALAASIREQGVISPIIVRRRAGGYELVAGERRLRAARAAGLVAIPAVIRDLADTQALELALVENIQRADLNALEEAEAYRRLTEDFGLSQEAVARRVGKDRSTVSNALRLLRLPRPILEDLAQGRLSEGHARALLAVEGEAEQLRLRDAIVSRKLSVRGAEALARGRPTPGRRGRRGPKDPNLAALEGRLREALGTRVRVVRRGNGGTLEIEFYSAEDLDRILDILGAKR